MGFSVKKLTVREMMFQMMIMGTEISRARKNLETIGFQPNWGCIARKIRWVKTTFTANSTTTLKDVS